MGCCCTPPNAGASKLNDSGSLLAAALLTVVVGILIARRGVHPVRAIALTAGRISAGQLAKRIPEANVPPELAELVAAFNAMLGRL